MKISTIIFSQRIALVIGIFLVLVGLGGSCGTAAHAIPEEPPLSELHKWYPIQDGAVILEYRIVNKDSVQLWRFKHAKKGAAVKIPACNEVALDGDEIRLVTQEPKPALYFIERKSNGFSPEFNLDFTYDKW